MHESYIKCSFHAIKTFILGLSPENARGVFVDLGEQRLYGSVRAEAVIEVPPLPALAVPPVKRPLVPVLKIPEARDVALHPPRLVGKTWPPLEKGHDQSLNPKRQLHPVM